MIAAPEFDFFNTVQQTVEELLPGGYGAEAKYLVDRIVAAGVAAGVPVIVGDTKSIEWLRALTSSNDDFVVLDIDLSHLDKPLVPDEEKKRVAQICQSVEKTFLIHPTARRLSNVSDSVVNGVAVIAQRLADAKDYQAAVSIAMLGGVLKGNRTGRAGDLFKFISQYAARKAPEHKAVTIAKDLYDHDQFAACAALLTCATRLQGSQDDYFHDVWSDLRENLFPHSLSLIEPSDLEAPDDLFLADQTKFSNSPASDTRRINAWIEDADEPLVLNRTYSFRVNVGKLRADALANAPLPRINWGERQELDILVVLSGSDFRISPRQRPLTLPRSGETKPVEFAITPLVAPSALLRVSFYLARELFLLEEFEISIAVKQPEKVAP
jgi:hypothetical protein